MKDFCELYNLENLIKDPASYKNAGNHYSIDVILTNRKNNFQNSMTIETGLSDYHKMKITVLKVHFKKQEHITIKFRSYKNFNESIFRNNLLNNLLNFNNEMKSYDDFKEIFMKVLNLYVPMKKKMVIGNNALFMNNGLPKAFIHRSKLKNKYNKNPKESNNLLYKKQRNLCVNLLKKEKKNYKNNLDLKILDDNKKFWQRIKALFSDKQNILKRNIIIVEKEVIIVILSMMLCMMTQYARTL